MKRLLIVCIAFALMAFADGKIAIINAFEKADVQAICDNLDNGIGIKPPGEFEFTHYSKTKASYWINTFYTEKNITGFEQTRVNNMADYTLVYGRLTGQRKYPVVIRINKTGDTTYRIASLKFN